MIVKESLKKVWNSDPAISLQRYFSRTLKLLNLYPGKFVRHLAIPKKFYYDIDGNHGFWMNDSGYRLEKALYWKGIKGHEFGTITLFSKMAPFCDWVIDIGANTGLFALIARSLNQKAKIFAFEPMPFFENIINKNNELNGFDIKILEKAVSDIEQKLTFYMPAKGKGNIYSSTVKIEHYLGHQETTPETIEVNCIRLDNFFLKHEFFGIGIIKIDAEGNDYEVLKSMGNYLSILQPVLIVENRSKEVADKMMELPGMESYRFLSIDDGTGTFKKINIPMDSQGRNILFYPVQKSEFLNRVLAP